MSQVKRRACELDPDDADLHRRRCCLVRAAGVRSVEGGCRGASVLASAGLAVWRPQAVVVGATMPLTSRPSHHEREPGVLAAGYELALFDGLNRFYVRDDEPELRERLAVPANYIPYRWAVRLGCRFRDLACPSRVPVGRGGSRVGDGRSTGRLFRSGLGGLCR